MGLCGSVQVSAPSRVFQHQQILERLRRLFPSKGKGQVTGFGSVELNRFPKCDTFSRSQDAVFELSMRFAEAAVLPAGLDEQAAAEKERLMFHELTQSPSPRFG